MNTQADLEKAFHRIPWLTELSPAQLARLAGITSIIQLKPGELLLKEGDREDFLYVLLEGQLVLEIEVPTRGQVPFYTAETLDVIGWSSLTPIVRQCSASAHATKPSMLIGIQSELLEQLCEEDHQIGYVFMRRLANIVANHMLTMRICLMEIISSSPIQPASLKTPLLTGIRP